MSSNKIEREHFAFLKSYWEQIKLLPSKKQKCEVFEAILSVQFFEKEINSISFSNQNQMILWEGLKPILKQSQKGYLDKMGLKGLNPSQGAKQAPPQHKDKDEDKDKEFEREGEGSDNIYLHLYGSERNREVDKFIKYLIANEDYVKSETAFTIKIKKKLKILIEI
jgi:hypothetical protein